MMNFVHHLKTDSAPPIQRTSRLYNVCNARLKTISMFINKLLQQISRESNQGTLETPEVNTKIH